MSDLLTIDSTFYHQLKLRCHCQGCPLKRVHRELRQTSQEGQQNQDSRGKSLIILFVELFAMLTSVLPLLFADNNTYLKYSGLSTLRLLVTKTLLPMIATGSTPELLPLLISST